MSIREKVLFLAVIKKIENIIQNRVYRVKEKYFSNEKRLEKILTPFLDSSLKFL